MKIFIVVKLQFEGIHQWSKCPIEEVSFLRNPHRHIFHVTAKKEVSDLDREVEIILLKRQIEIFLIKKWNGILHELSCEMIAKIILEQFNLSYCSVLEDGENGSEVIA